VERPVLVVAERLGYFGFTRGPRSAADTEIVFESDELCQPARCFSTAPKIEDRTFFKGALQLLSNRHI